MPTECSAEQFDFGVVEDRSVVASFDGGAVTSDAGALLVGAADRAIGLMDVFATCFTDWRCAEQIEHEVVTLVSQRVFGIALGYEDLVDHDDLRHDPVMAVLAGKLEARRKDCGPVAGKSTLNRLELSRGEPSRYHKIAHDGAAIERLLVDQFLDAHGQAPRQIILDLDATDDPLHGQQEGRFFHGYHDCYCYLPLYVFSGRHLVAAKLRRSNIDASAGAVEEVARIVTQIRARWPKARILLRANSGFAREELMGWCETNSVDYVFGLARNVRLVAELEAELAAARAKAKKTGAPARRFKDFLWSTLNSWSCRRRVIGKAEWTQDEANPRFIVTSLDRREVRRAVSLRAHLLRPRRHGEPHQGVPARPLCRPDLGGDHASQPAAAVVRFHGVCSPVRGAPHRPFRDRIRQGHLRHHSAQAVEDRGAGAHQCPPHQDCHGLGLPHRCRVGPRRPSPPRRRTGSRLARLTCAAAARHHRRITSRPTEIVLQEFAPSQTPKWRHGSVRPQSSNRASRQNPCRSLQCGEKSNRHRSLRYLRVMLVARIDGDAGQNFRGKGPVSMAMPWLRISGAATGVWPCITTSSKASSSSNACGDPQTIGYRGSADASSAGSTSIRPIMLADFLHRSVLLGGEGGEKSPTETPHQGAGKDRPRWPVKFPSRN